MAEDTAWGDLHVEAWEWQARQARTKRGQDTVERNAQQFWRRRVKQADRNTFIAAAGQRAALTANIAKLVPLPPEPNTDNLDILSPWFERAWDLLVARRRLGQVLGTMMGCIPRNGTSSGRTRAYLEGKIATHRARLDALQYRLGVLPTCRPSNYADSLEDDSPSPADDEGRRIPNYLQRQREAFAALKGKLPGTRDTINAVITTNTHVPGNAAARYVRYLGVESALADSVMDNLTELIEGLSAWADADTRLVEREEAISGNAPSLEDRVAYTNNLPLWDQCRDASTSVWTALNDLIALRQARGDPSTTNLEAHLRDLRQDVRNRVSELDSQADDRRIALENLLEEDKNNFWQSRPVLPWHRCHAKLGRGNHGEVEAWAKRDHNNNVVNRVARKWTKNKNPNDNDECEVWHPPDRNMPLEVAAMYKLRALKESSKSIVQIRNWRPLQRANKQGGQRCLIYMSTVQHGDLKLVTEPDSEGEEFGLPPEAFIWSVVESLAEAGLLMQRGEVADSPPDLLEWSQIVHGDMKPDNVLLDINTTGRWPGFPRAKLADFGISVIHPFGMYWEGFCEEDWGAPEHVRGPKEHLGPPGSAANVWGIGMVVRMLIMQDYDLPMKGEPNWPTGITDKYSKLLINLLNKCLKLKPDKRPSLVNIKKAATTRSGDAKHDAAIEWRTVSQDDQRWEEMNVRTKNTDVPLALARDADGDVGMVGGPTGKLVGDSTPPRDPDDPPSDNGVELDELDDEHDWDRGPELDEGQDDFGSNRSISRGTRARSD
ncbi:hypothetical protein BST61_g3879 [Cercospora zeina]